MLPVIIYKNLTIFTFWSIQILEDPKSWYWYAGVMVNTKMVEFAIRTKWYTIVTILRCSANVYKFGKDLKLQTTSEAIVMSSATKLQEQEEYTGIAIRMLKIGNKVVCIYNEKKALKHRNLLIELC